MPLGGREKSIPPRLMCPSQHEKRVWVSELEEGTGLCVAPFAESLLKDIFPHTQTQEGSIALCGGGIVDEVKVNIKSYQYTPSSFPQH